MIRIHDGYEELIEWPQELGGYFHSATVEPSGVFWIAQGASAARCAVPTWRIPPGCPEIDMQVYMASEDDRGRLWFAALDRLLCLEDGKWKTYILPDGQSVIISTIQKLCPYPDDRIVVLVSNGSLLILDPHTRKFQPLSHPAGRKIKTITPRAEGGFWIATLDESLPQAYIETLEGERFDTVLGETEETRMVNVLSHPFILETKDGELWCPWNGRVGRYTRSELQLIGPKTEHPYGNLNYFTEIEDGVIWAGGHNKIVEFKGDSWRTLQVDFGNVHQIVRRRDGSLLAATHQGILQYVENSWVANTMEDGLPNSHCYMVYEDQQSRLWAGTARGLALYDPTIGQDPPKTIIREENNLKETAPGGEAHIIYSGESESE